MCGHTGSPPALGAGSPGHSLSDREWGRPSSYSASDTGPRQPNKMLVLALCATGRSEGMYRRPKGLPNSREKGEHGNAPCGAKKEALATPTTMTTRQQQQQQL